METQPLVLTEAHAPPIPRLQASPDAGERSQNALFSVPTNIRRKLEGGIEVLEAAHGRYATLEKLLREPEWQPQVQARLDLLRKSIRQESAILEALARLRQWAGVEGGSETESALVLAREVEGLRARLEMLTNKCLGLSAFRKSNLVENLDRLERAILQTAPTRPASEEPLLLWGGFSPALEVPGLLALGLFPILGLVLLGETSIASARVCGGAFVLWLFFDACWLLAQHKRSGCFWLTPTRLIWQPTGRAPIHIPLHAIRPRGIRLLSDKSVKVSVADGRTLYLRFIPDAVRFAAAMEFHQQRSSPLSKKGEHVEGRGESTRVHDSSGGHLAPPGAETPLG